MSEHFVLSSPSLAVEKAVVALLRSLPELSSSEQIDIVAASDRDVVVGPLHVFVLCTELVPVAPANPNSASTVAIALVTDMDDHGQSERQRWLGYVHAALTREHVTTFTHGTTDLKGWSIQSQRETSQDRKTMDVLTLRVGAYT